ncbi:MAG: beta-1,6-N-acetylglucosaminyltransferase [Acidimicrobiia bacterium]|nr:beta-1,6-N-acetylglucosaminyltransferase [Acidimicrobiia bacterium]
MRLAVLITAYHQPDHLARLVDRLTAEWVEFFIHVDRKADLDGFTRALPPGDGVTYLAGRQRERIRWGGLSLTRAQLHLVRAALAASPRVDRVALLSGSDYPIAPLERIHQMLDGDTEFLRVNRSLSGEDGHSINRIVRHYYFLDVPLLPAKRRLQLSEKIPRRPYRKIPQYHGWSWWSLTRPCAEHIIRFLDENPGYLRWHRWSFLPEEVVFQSIVKASPFAGKLSHDATVQPIAEPTESGATYIDFDVGLAYSPKTLTVGDFDALAASRCVFARKFDETASAGLLDRIDADLLGTAAGPDAP